MDCTIHVAKTKAQISFMVTAKLHGYREADLRLCFRLCKLLVFSCEGSYNINYIALNFSLGARNEHK